MEENYSKINYFNYDGIYEKIFKNKENNIMDIKELVKDFLDLESKVEGIKYSRNNLFYNNTDNKFLSIKIPISKSNLSKYLISKYNEDKLFNDEIVRIKNYNNCNFIQFLISYLIKNFYIDIFDIENLMKKNNQKEIIKQKYEEIFIDYFNDFLFYDIRSKKKLNNNEKYYIEYCIRYFYSYFFVMNNGPSLTNFKEIFFNYSNNEDFLDDENFKNNFIRRFLLTEI